MAFSRNSLAAAFAGTLSLAVLTGCPSQPVVTPPVASPTTPAATPTAPGATPTAPGATATPGDGTPTAAPSTTPSKSPLVETTVQGKVYDEAGALVNTGAKVTIKSLNPSNPFETTVDVVNGNYVANSVPSGVLVEITATRDGWTSRTRVETPLPLSSQTQGGNQYNFGGSTDPYFISKYPEVTSVEPADEATLTDNTQLVYKLTLSEPLNTDNRDRFSSALRVWSLGTGTLPTGVNVDSSTAPTAVPAGSPIQEGTPFLSSNNLATVTWDAAGKVATLTVKAPLRTDDDNKFTYAVGLVGDRLTSSNVISDQDNNVLGQYVVSSTVAFGGYSGQTGLIKNVFKKRELPVLSSGGSAVTGAEKVWDWTHDDTQEFYVAQDNTDPTFATVSVAGRNVLQLTFSEPMAALSGAATFSNGATTATNYRVMFAKEANAFTSSDDDLLEATTPAGGSLNRWSTSTAGATTGLADTSAAPNKTAAYTFATAGSDDFEVVLDENDPKIVRIRRDNLIDPNVALDKIPTIWKHARVLVMTTLQDPAGNSVSNTADANIKTISF